MIDPGTAMLASSALGGALGIFNSSRANKNAEAASAQQWAREYGAYKTRYQDTMTDMRSAGLNPIMAASGGFNVGSGPSASTAQTYQAPTPTIDYSASARNLAEAEKSKEQSNLTKKQIVTEIKKAENLTKEGRVLNQKELKLIADTGLLINQHAKTSEDIKLSQKQQKQMDLLNIRLESLIKKISKQGSVYDNAYGTILTYIRETLGSIGALISGVPVQLLKP